MTVSLLDLADRATATWYVVYTESRNPLGINRWLKPRFQHVELWKRVPYGPEPDDQFWVRVDPGLEMMTVDVRMEVEPHWGHVVAMQRVMTAAPLRRVRSWFHVGPVTCVELAKALLGINHFWLRTPWQLFKYIRKRKGILVL